MQLGYTMLCEQTAPKQLVSGLVRAEEIGVDFSVIEFAEAELLPALKDVATAVRSRAKPAEPTVEAGGDGLSQAAEAVRRVQASLA